MSNLKELWEKVAFLKVEIAKKEHALIINRAEFSDIMVTRKFKGIGNGVKRLNFANRMGVRARRQEIQDSQWYLERDEKELKQVQEKIASLQSGGDEFETSSTETSKLVKKSKSTHTKTITKEKVSQQPKTRKRDSSATAKVQKRASSGSDSSSEWKDPQG